MELALLIYGISLLPQITGSLTFLTIVAVAVTIVGLIVWGVNLEEPSYRSEAEIARQRALGTSAKFWIKRGSTWVLILGVLNIIVPSEKTSYMMVGAYAAQTVAQSETVGKVLTESGKISNKILTIINGKLDTYVEEAINEVDKATAKKPEPAPKSEPTKAS